MYAYPINEHMYTTKTLTIFACVLSVLCPKDSVFLYIKCTSARSLIKQFLMIMCSNTLERHREQLSYTESG